MASILDTIKKAAATHSGSGSAPTVQTADSESLKVRSSSGK